MVQVSMYDIVKWKYLLTVDIPKFAEKHLQSHAFLYYTYIVFPSDVIYFQFLLLIYFFQRIKDNDLIM